jgi:magnesium transporter
VIQPPSSPESTPGEILGTKPDVKPDVKLEVKPEVKPGQRSISRHPQVPARPGIRLQRLATCGQSLEWADLSSGEGLWVDVENPTPEDIAKLGAFFAINPLALEDSLERGHWSRFESYAEHAFLIFRTLAEPEDATDRTERVSLLYYPALGSLVTLRNEPVTYVEGVWHELERKEGCTVTAAMYAILMQGTDTFFDFLDAFEARTDQLEEDVFEPRMSGQEARAFTATVFELKHTLAAARRLASGARESVAQFSRFLPAEAQMYTRDVVDHLARVYEGLDGERDALSTLLDVHLTVQSNRMNEVMKTLTTVSTIFLPLTFLAGVWGMNFRFMPELAQPWGYAMAWGVFAGVAALLAIMFKRRGWW